MEILDVNKKLIVYRLCNTYKQKTVLSDLSFDVEKGEFLSVLGPDGCGKTTLLRTLIGLESQDSGKIIKEGMEISKLLPSERGMGIVFQKDALFPNMTVLENVQYALTLSADKKEQAREIAIEMLDMLGESESLEKMPRQLSVGQRQLVSVARTLAMNPDIILLDEVFSALDANSREVMKRKLKEIQKKFNITMILATHDPEEAFYLSDRVMIMSEGNMEQIDTPENIYKRPKNQFVREFAIEYIERKYDSILKCMGSMWHEEK